MRSYSLKNEIYLSKFLQNVRRTLKVLIGFVASQVFTLKL